MLNTLEIDKVIAETAEIILGRGRVSDVQTRVTVDSLGRDALSVNIVLKRGVFAKVRDQGVLPLLSEIQRRLQAIGEDRLPIVDFVTEEELDAIDDPES